MQASCRWMESYTPTDGQMECCGSLFPVSQGDDFWWTASAIADGANGPNRKSPAGLGVEKMRGEGTFPLTRNVAQMGHGSRKF